MPTKSLSKSIIIKKSRTSQGKRSDTLYLVECIALIAEIIGGLLAFFLLGIFLIVGLILLIMFAIEAFHFWRMTKGARFYQKSLWFGQKRFEKTQVQELDIHIDRTKTTPQLCFKLVEKNGRKHSYMLDRKFKPDEIQPLVNEIIAYGECFYPFRMEIIP